MRSAFEVSAEEVINTDPVTATTDESISQIKNRMEENELRAIPVVDEEENFSGAISYRELVRYVQFNPEITAPEKMMHQPPEFELDENLVELSDLRINSGRKMIIALENGKLEGIIGDYEFLDVLEEVSELDEISTSRLANFDVLTVDEDESLEKARHMMLDNNISRLPVIDNGELTGKIDSVDILRMMIKRERQAAGGTSGRREGTREVNIAGGNEKEELSDVTVNQLMQESYLTNEEHMTAVEAVRSMKEDETDEIIFVEDGYPEEIVTLKDIIDHLAELAQRQTIMVQLTGVELPEEKAALHDKIRTQLQGSLGRKLKNPQEFKLRVRKKEKDGKKHRWELEVQLVSEYGVTSIDEEGWKLLDTLDEALNELNTVIRKEHEKRTEHR